MAPSQLTVATFNIHCGVDGWGRPFDVVAECRRIDADVLVLQESWAPDAGDPSTAARVAEGLGYHRVEVGLAHGRLAVPDPLADDRWGPGVRHGHATLTLDEDRRRRVARHRPRASTAGTWGLAVLSRQPLADATVLPLGQLRKDPARRVAIRGTVSVGGTSLVVHGTHMSHLLQRSPVQFRELAKALPGPGTLAVVAGDMNLWGPAVTTLLRGWRRAVVGRTWPSGRPHSQVDHLLVNPSVVVVDTAVVDTRASDHRPVRATLAPA